ncbi:MAG: ATP-binding protein [Pseudomonadales bacterium]
MIAKRLGTVHHKLRVQLVYCQAMQTLRKQCAQNVQEPCKMCVILACHPVCRYSRYMRIQTKLLLSFFLASLLLVGGLYLLLQWSVDRGVLNYVNQQQAKQFTPAVDELASYYVETESWEEFSDNPRAFHELLRELNLQGANGKRRPAPPAPRAVGPRERPSHRRPPPHRDGPPRPPGGGTDIGLLDALKNVVVMSNPDGAQLLAISNEGNIVGWLSLPSFNRVADDYELNFLEQSQETLLLICGGIFALCLLIAYPMARHLTRPLMELEKSTSRLAAGSFDERIQLDRKDELGSLGRSLNELAKTLERNDGVRKRWLADTSHELRTPLSIVRAQLGAMLDDIRPLSKAEVEVALKQVQHLQKLMDDLYELSNADIGALRYTKQSIDLSELISEVAEAHRSEFEERDITFKVYSPEKPITVYADPSRLHQLIDNILRNSCKYTNDGGKVSLDWTVHERTGLAVITLEDSLPGVPVGTHERLFEHLYRGESSRNRDSGGSGLGLAICKRIVEAHDGSIQASKSQYDGLKIQVSIPTSKLVGESR